MKNLTNPIYESDIILSKVRDFIEVMSSTKITMLCKKAPKISKQSFINVSDGSDCIIYVKSKSVKSDLQKQFKSKNIESKIIVK
jgi:hypothetical protein